ncbi:MAG: hypothetical protein ACJ72Z_12460 [Pyrinomonadaceae bacterium]
MMQRDELFSTMDYILSIEVKIPIAFLNSIQADGETLSNVVDYGAGHGGIYGYFQDLEDAESWLLEREI